MPGLIARLLKLTAGLLLTASLSNLLALDEPPAAAGSSAAETNSAKETGNTSDDNRHYPFTGGYDYDLRIAAYNGMALHRLTSDLYMFHAAEHLNGGFGNFVSGAFSAFFTYFYTLWPHEFGHYFRGKQTGVDFTFHNLNPILPHTTFEVPAGKKLTDEEDTLLSIAGFEVNTLVALRAERDLYQNNSAFSDEMIHGWVNKMFFPIYALLVFPTDSESVAQWKNPRGDPAFSVLPVYRRHSGRKAIKKTGGREEVDPYLSKLYNTTVMLSALTPLTDPFFYQALVEDFSKDDYTTRRKVSPWILAGNRQNGWTYGTHFNPGLLGPEIYFINYIFINNQMYALTLKGGGPFTNYGFKIELPGLYKDRQWRLGPWLEGWHQSFYGTGLAAGIETGFQFQQNAGLWLNIGYKSSGYSPGLVIDDSLLAVFGLTVSLE